MVKKIQLADHFGVTTCQCLSMGMEFVTVMLLNSWSQKESQRWEHLAKFGGICKMLATLKKFGGKIPF